MVRKLEQFEKWWRKVSMEGDWDYEEYAQRGWEAALEWVLKKENEVRFCWRADYKSEENIPTVYDEIREELDGNK